MNELKEEYNEDTLMPNGRFAFWKLKDIPTAYLITLWDCSKGGGNLLLRQWLQDNVEQLRLNPHLGKLKKRVALKCKKETYPTESDARFRLKSIRNTTVDEQRKIPIRIYECPICSGWHLTSKPHNNFIPNE